MRTSFIKTLTELANQDRNIFLLTADLGFKLFDEFRETLPERFINVGVAEQNMIGIAAGLALSGKNVYCYSMVPFLTMRALEQIRIDLCYHNLNTKLIGVGGGLTYGQEGVTHHAIEDLAIMRTLPNITVVAPGDPVEAKEVIKESANHQGPIYVRLGRDGDPKVHENKIDFKIGKGIVISKGDDIAIIATGSMLYPAKILCDKLAIQGLNMTLISMHTIKPLDKKLVQELKNRNAIFTIEEHSIIGGLGSAVAEVLMESSYNGLFRRIGLPDEYSPCIGKCEYRKEKVGLSIDRIMHYILIEYEEYRNKRGKV